MSTPEKANNPYDIDIHPATAGLLEAIAKAPYIGDVRKLMRTAPGIVLVNQLSATEAEAIITAGQRRKAALSLPAAAEPPATPDHDVELPPAEWSPLATLPPERDDDWAERQSKDSR